jgi:hypothetical protein
MAADSVLWKCLWAIRAPGKMKVNLWRLAHDCLPTEQQMCRRHIPTSASCAVCTMEESADHVFLRCQYAREVWREVKKTCGMQLRRKHSTSIKTWLFDFLGRSTERECMFLTVTFWHLWTTRNAVRNRKPLRASHSVAYQIQAYAEMIELHLFKPQSSTRRDMIRLQRIHNF